MSSNPRRRLLALTTLLTPVVLLGACSDGGDTVPLDEAPTTASATGNADSEYCRAAARFSGDAGLDLSGDPDAALAGIEQMAAAAPDEIADDLAVVVEGVRGLDGLDANDPDALAALFELLADPQVETAIERVEQYTSSECGIDLGSDESAAGAEIELEDVDAVKDTNSGSTWADKLSTTVINFGSEVTVSSGEGELSADEALEACDALVSSLSSIDPDVTVEVAAGDTVLARSSDGSCVAA